MWTQETAKEIVRPILKPSWAQTSVPLSVSFSWGSPKKNALKHTHLHLENGKKEGRKGGEGKERGKCHDEHRVFVMV